MDPRPRQLLVQRIAQYGLALCDQPGRCRGLLQDDLQGACDVELNVLLLVQQHGIVHDLRVEVQAPTRPAELLVPQLIQKLRSKVPLDETAARWGIEAWAEALGIRLPLPPPPLPRPNPLQKVSLIPAEVPPRKRLWSLPTIVGGCLMLLIGLVMGWQRGYQIGREQGKKSGTSVIAGSSLTNRIGMEFVLIPAGEFWMGSNDGDDNEKPVHKVGITTPFYLGKYEVTQAQWQVVMDNNPSQFKYSPEFPVESVSWHDIHTFIEKLNTRERGVRYRLPTEAEWEYAARGRDGRTYPWSNQFDGTRLNFCDRNCEYKGMRDTSTDDNYATTAPVGTYSNGQNAFGTYDMAGNVWEWVQDWYANDEYKRRTVAGGVVVNPAGPPEGSRRVIRGGSWYSGADRCRMAYRGSHAPDVRYGSLGFRLLREVP